MWRNLNQAPLNARDYLIRFVDKARADHMIIPYSDDPHATATPLFPD